MNFNKKLAVAVSGAVLLMAGQFALADSTTDIVDALVSKGVLTEEEGKLISKGAKSQKEAQDKAVKGKLSISSTLDNASLYGDIRVRHEMRSGTGVFGTSTTTVPGAEQKVNKDRYKITLGVKTESGDLYSDIALAMGKRGRSDNADFGTTDNGIGNKETIFLKRAMFGWKATPWLTLEAGRLDNPLYTTSMVYDADLQFQGFVEKAKFNFGTAEVFFTGAEHTIVGPKATYSAGSGASTPQNGMLTFQGGLRYPFDDKTSAKAALTYTYYTHDSVYGKFQPGLSSVNFSGVSTNASSATTTGNYGVNNLDVIEIPAELNYFESDNKIGFRVFEDFAYNTSGSSRRAASAVSSTKIGSSDDYAYSLGFVVGSAKDLKAFEGNKLAKGDWQMKFWYQDTGAYSIDANLVDTDVFDARLNMKGIAVKAQYNLFDNLALNFTGSHATRSNKDLGTPTAPGNDLSLNLNDFDLYQFDATYKF